MQNRLTQLTARVASHLKLQAHQEKQPEPQQQRQVLNQARENLQAWLLNYIGPVDSNLKLKERLSELLISLEAINTFQAPLLDRLAVVDAAEKEDEVIGVRRENRIRDRLNKEFARLIEEDISVETLQKTLATLLRVEGADIEYQRELTRLFPHAQSIEDMQMLDGLLAVIDALQMEQKVLDQTLEPYAVIHQQTQALIASTNLFQDLLFAKLHPRVTLPAQEKAIHRQLLNACYLQIKTEADVHLFLTLCAPLKKGLCERETNAWRDLIDLQEPFCYLDNQFQRLAYEANEKLKCRSIIARNLSAYAEETLLTEQEDELGRVSVQTTHAHYHCGHINHAKARLGEPKSDDFDDQIQRSIRDLRTGNVATTIKTIRRHEDIQLEKKEQEEKVNAVRKNLQDEIQDINQESITRDIISKIAEVNASHLSLPRLTEYFVARAELADIIDSLLYQEKIQLQLWCVLSPTHINDVPEMLRHIKMQDLFITKELKSVLSDLRYSQLSLVDGVTQLDNDDYEVVMSNIKKCRLAMENFLSLFNNGDYRAYYNFFNSAQYAMNNFLSDVEGRLKKLVAGPGYNLKELPNYKYTRNSLKELQPQFAKEKQVVYQACAVIKKENIDEKEKECEDANRNAGNDIKCRNEEVTKMQENTLGIMVNKERKPASARLSVVGTMQNEHVPVAASNTSGFWGFWQPIIHYFKRLWSGESQHQENTAVTRNTNIRGSVVGITASLDSQSGVGNTEKKSSHAVKRVSFEGAPAVVSSVPVQTGLLPRMSLLARPSAAVAIAPVVTQESSPRQNPMGRA